MILLYKGIKINYNTLGKGIPVVFLHGFLENLNMWEKTTESLTDSYQCILIDLLGHGHSGNIGYIHTMEDMAKAVKTVLENLGISKAVFVGHSMGGYVSLACVDLFPDLILGIALLNSTSFPDSEERKYNRTRAINIVKKNPNAYTSMAIANLFAEENQLQFASEIHEIKNQASKMSLQGIISALEGMKIRKDRTNILANFKGFKVIFAGIKDPILPYKQSCAEAKQNNVDLVSLEGGHMSYLENKEQYMIELSRFLNSI
ncbi:alpha/beta fold hydrolase [Aquimarina muelleri]|uniref:alpha/beta fold hydrolase n=1 Tax=Aquimarina muelleri TaxID=279356 RepID=UPI003F686AB4